MSPKIGEHAYRGPGQEGPVTVVAVEGERVFYAFGHIELLSTHQGNLYYQDGERPWCT